MIWVLMDEVHHENVLLYCIATTSFVVYGLLIHSVMKTGKLSVICASSSRPRSTHNFNFDELADDRAGRRVTNASSRSILWYCVTIILILVDFPRLTSGESVIPQSTSPYTTMSDVSISRHITHFITPPPPTPGDAGRTNRLDFISVAVICGVVAFCFIICVIVGCRRKKRRHHLPRCEDMTPTVISPSVTETDGPTLRATAGERTDSAENSSPSGLRRHTESPPPTYSVIERQTSFSSYVSQTSSMIEVPPDYDDAWNPDVSTDTDVSRLSHAGSTRRTRPAGAGRSASSRGSKQPPRARSHRSYSDAEGRRRMRSRPSSRPSPLSEDDVVSEVDTAARSIDVIIEVNPSPRSSAAIEQSLDEASAINESSQPLIVNLGQRSTAASSEV